MKSKKPSKKRQIFELLWEGRWVPARELNSIGGFRYGGRIHELRRLGFEIVCQKIKGHEHYKLVTPAGRIDYFEMKLKPREIPKPGEIQQAELFPNRV